MTNELLADYHASPSKKILTPTKRNAKQNKLLSAEINSCILAIDDNINHSNSNWSDGRLN